MTTGLLMLAMFTVCYTLLAKTLSNGILTAPILFVGFGYAMAQTDLFPLWKPKDFCMSSPKSR